jgi:ferredoxin-type protein NapH
LIGFHLIDLNSALQVMLAHKHIIVNLVIGTTPVMAIWMLLGGRTFCSWVCPYHLLAEWAEKLHLWMAKQKAGVRPDHEPRPAHLLLGGICSRCAGHWLHRV